MCPDSSASTGGYAIKVRGCIDERWAHWFDGVTVLNHENGQATLLAPGADQAALHGLLTRLRDLNLTLESVTRMAPDLPGALAGSATPTSP